MSLLRLSGFLIGSLMAGAAFAQNVIGTFAGTEFLFPAGRTLALSAPLGSVQDVALDVAGNLYISDRDNHIVVRVANNGSLVVFAGNGLAGFSGDGGLAVDASMQQPLGLALDASGNLFIADSAGNRVRKVDGEGTITTVAGTGVAGFSGDGLATANQLNQPAGLAIDSSGNLYIADSLNNLVRKVTPAGLMTTFAGTGQAATSGDGGPATQASLNTPTAVKIDGAGNVYIATTAGVRLVTPDNKIETVMISTGAFGLILPAGLAIDAQNNLYVSDAFNSQVLRVTANGSATIIAGNGIAGFSGDGGPAVNAKLNNPRGLATSAAGVIYVADRDNLRVRQIDPDRTIRTAAGNGNYQFFGDGEPAVGASLRQPISVATDGLGNVFIADLLNNRIRKVTTDGVINTVAGNGTPGYSGDGQPATSAALDGPRGVTVDDSGFYITDTTNNAVRKVDLQGVIRTIAGGGGGQATATLSFPTAIAVDGTGNLYIADTFDNLIRKLTPDMTITTVAGGGNSTADSVAATTAILNAPQGVAVDSQGRLYISDTDNNLIRMVANGIINTIAGGGTATGENLPATIARVDSPRGLAVDAAGNLYYAEFNANRVRRVFNGVVSTAAGILGNGGFAGDGGLAVNALLSGPAGVALDQAGNLYIADSNNNRIRKVFAAPPNVQVSPGNLSFSGLAGGLRTAPQLINITSANLTGLPFSVSLLNHSPWLNVFPVAGAIPASLEISADPSSLTAGSYQEKIHIDTLNANPGFTDVNIQFDVANPGQPLQSVQPTALSFAFVVGTGSKSQTITVANLGGGSLTFTVQAANPGTVHWLSVSVPSGTATPTTPAFVGVTASPGPLPPGTYVGAVTIVLSTGTPTTIPVTMTISTVPQTILLSQSGLTFTAVEGGGVVPSQSFSVLNVGLGVMNWTVKVIAQPGAKIFLSASPPAGSTDASSTSIPSVTVTANAANVKPGEYFNQVEVDSPTALNSPQYVPVVLQVLDQGHNPGPVVEPSELVFTGVAGVPPPGSQNLMIYNLQGGSLNYRSQATTADGINWIAYLPTAAAVEGAQPTRLVLQPDTTKLGPGIQQGVLTLSFDDGSARRINVLDVVLAPGAEARDRSLESAQGACTPKNLVLSLTTIGPAFVIPAGYPNALDVTVLDDCGHPMIDGSVVTSFSNGDSPLALVSLRDGHWSATWTPSTTPASVTTTVRAESPSLGLKQTLQVSGSTSSTQANPNISPGGVVNAANFAARQPLAPGDMIVIFGSDLTNGPAAAATGLPLDTTLAGTGAFMAGQLLPLTYAGPHQVNAILPYNLNSDTNYQVIVTAGARYSQPEQITIAAAQPAIFETSEGPAIFDTKGLIGPSNPAQRGGVVSIFAVGLGAVTGKVIPGVAPGPVPTTTTAAVKIGNLPATVLYSGLAPAFPGLYQVNVQIPAGVATGNNVPLVVTILGQSSPMVAMSVR